MDCLYPKREKDENKTNWMTERKTLECITQD